MQQIAFAQLGKTIVLSDLHLNMLCGRFEEVQRRRIADALGREDPETVILNGDTVDLFFGIRAGKRGAEIETILTENAGVVKLLAEVPNLYVLAGAHDQAVRWDAKICDALRSYFPNCRGLHDGLVDLESKIVVVPGTQWYYDNIVQDGSRWLSLTSRLTAIFEEFLLSGKLDVRILQTFYLEGRLGFWYKSGSHYEFLQGMAKVFECRIADYFDQLADICRGPHFGDWVEDQFYDEYRWAGRLAAMQAEDGGPAMEALAVPYWRMLGKVVKQRTSRYLNVGVLDYPPHSNIPFNIAVVGHTHFARTSSNENGRQMLFSGSTKPQTRISGASGFAQNEMGGGYVVIEREKARLEKFELEIWETDLQMLATECKEHERGSTVTVQSRFKLRV